MVRIPLIHRVRFSLRTLFVLLFASAIGLSNYLVSQKWHEAQTETQRLRDDLGVLTIGNHKRFYVCEQPKMAEPFTWQWRIYVPSGEFDIWLAGGGIPKTGLNVSGDSAQAKLKSGEYTLTARIERDPLGKWRLVVWAPSFGQSLEIPPESATWLGESTVRHHGIQSTRKLQTEKAGSTPTSLKKLAGETQSFSANETLVLLRLRAPEDLTNDNGQPCDGVMIWFQKSNVSRSKGTAPSPAPPSAVAR